MVVSWSENVLSSSDAVVPVPKSLSSPLSIGGARAQCLMFELQQLGHCDLPDLQAPRAFPRDQAPCAKGLAEPPPGGG